MQDNYYFKKIKRLPAYISYLLKRIARKLLTGNRESKRPTRTFDEFFSHIKSIGFVPATIIDVGAARGTFSLHHAFPDAYFVLFEPLADFVPELQKLMANYRGEIHQCALLSRTEANAKILKTRDLFGSSLMHDLKSENDPRLQNVESNTLDDMLNNRELTMPVLMKTDCQGSDLQVLKGGEQFLEKCDLLIVEVSFFKFWGPHHPDALEIINYLDNKGFVIYDFLDGLFRPLDNALGQIDMVFVKRDGIFRKDQHWLARQ